MGSGKNTSSAYLTGYLCGKKALKEGIEGAVLDLGLKTSINGSKIYAALKGAVDAGMNIPHNESILPQRRDQGRGSSGLRPVPDQAELEKILPVPERPGTGEATDHFESIKEKIEAEENYDKRRQKG